MNKQLKELIDYMQKGWKMLPRNPTCDISFSGSKGMPTAACPLVHAYLGKTGKVTTFENVAHEFPIISYQRVRLGNGFTSLEDAIIRLADSHDWSTPKVIAWLKTHLD